MKTHLLIIDPQNDFCEVPDPAKGLNGDMFIPGADTDMLRLSIMISKESCSIDEIHITLDTHQDFDISHPIYWVDENGNNPEPFTIIDPEDINNGKWKTSRPELQDRSKEYVEQLDKQGKYPLCVWPPHCIVGTNGHCVHGQLMNSLRDWSSETLKNINYIYKGTNPYTEHYSGIKADIPDPSDVHTWTNHRLLSELMKADHILVAGEASSHCVLSTVTDIADEHPQLAEKMILLVDAMSPVVHPVIDFAAVAQRFFKDMESRGVRISTSDLPLK